MYNRAMGARVVAIVLDLRDATCVVKRSMKQDVVAMRHSNDEQKARDSEKSVT